MSQDDFEELARNIGLRVVEMRRAQGLRQIDLARLIPGTVAWLSKIEQGTQNLTLATMVKLSRALRVRVVDLFAAPSAGRKPSKRGRPRTD